MIIFISDLVVLLIIPHIHEYVHPTDAFIYYLLHHNFKFLHFYLDFFFLFYKYSFDWTYLKLKLSFVVLPSSLSLSLQSEKRKNFSTLNKKKKKLNNKDYGLEYYQLYKYAKYKHRLLQQVNE